MNRRIAQKIVKNQDNPDLKYTEQQIKKAQSKIRKDQTRGGSYDA